MAMAEAKEIVLFAEWAFGPYGLLALQVLTFGDFSYGNSFYYVIPILYRSLLVRVSPAIHITI